MKGQQEYALITGASQGIGRAIAIEFSKRNINTLLIALDTPNLQDVKSYIHANFNTEVDALGIDLTEKGFENKIYEWCTAKGYVVKYLINNAGFGEGNYFEAIPLEVYQRMIDLNVKAYVSLIHRFLPDMKKSGAAHIMNTSSMEAFLPLPYKSVYNGTKNFIYAFSLALNKEAGKFGVKVSVLCPGSVLTNEGGLKRIKAMGWKAKLIMMMPDEVASIAIKNMLKGMAIIIPGKMNWWISKVQKLIPTRIKMMILEKMFRAYA